MTSTFYPHFKSSFSSVVTFLLKTDLSLKYYSVGAADIKCFHGSASGVYVGYNVVETK